MIRLKCDSFDTDIGIQMMKSKNKGKGKISITFCYSHCWPYIHVSLHSHSVTLEQVTTHFDSFEEVSVQLLSIDTNWKGGTLNKNFFILNLGVDYSKVSPLMATCSFYLVKQVSLTGCHRIMLVLSVYSLSKV